MGDGRMPRAPGNGAVMRREKHEWPGYLGMDFHTLGGRRLRCQANTLGAACRRTLRPNPLLFRVSLQQQTTGFFGLIPRLQRGAARPVKRMKGTKEDGKLLVLSGFPAPFSRYRERAVCGDTQKGKARG
ncbi:uncharacterized protein B0T23DRAFT_316591 [Neurospora hispaniola]|uniref:Uncharacterized protein n=1 Tax=Neurospora hispaniola TaxID=588809 RepID=A0AAJ0MRV6_9PEZI|nr:hypothetical protein B0T23DRAFT_316591 [Neurospora hispaniola]